MFKTGLRCYGEIEIKIMRTKKTSLFSCLFSGFFKEILFIVRTESEECRGSSLSKSDQIAGVEVLKKKDGKGKRQRQSLLAIVCFIYEQHYFRLQYAMQEPYYIGVWTIARYIQTALLGSVYRDT